MRYFTPHKFHGSVQISLYGALALLSVLSLSGCQRSEAVAQWVPPSPSPVTYLEDSVLTSRVRASLIMSPVINSFNIGVESHQGVVLLSGMAANQTQIDLAVFVAQTVPGVSLVDSFMFATGATPALAVRQSHVPDLNTQSADRFQVHLPGDISQQHQAQAEAEEPSEPASAVYAAVAPVPPPQGSNLVSTPPNESMPGPSRWVRIAHSVLGIGSIQDELQIKR